MYMGRKPDSDGKIKAATTNKGKHKLFIVAR